MVTEKVEAPREQAGSRAHACSRCGRTGHNLRTCHNPIIAKPKREVTKHPPQTAKVFTAAFRRGNSGPMLTAAGSIETQAEVPASPPKKSDLELYRELVTCSDCESLHSAPPSRPGVIRPRDTKPRCASCYSRYLSGQPPLSRKSWDPKGVGLKPTIGLAIDLGSGSEERLPKDLVPANV